MAIPGYEDYKKREFCSDVRCPVQIELNGLEAGSDSYEKVRKGCQGDCRFTAWQFHHWLIEKGYEIARPQTE
ncbi:MAG: hypothetical protein ABH879_05990 [archaeon]